MNIETYCKFCKVKYTIHIHRDFRYIECCSDDCKKHYFKATKSGFNISKTDDKFSDLKHSSADLVIKYRKRLRL